MTPKSSSHEILAEVAERPKVLTRDGIEVHCKHDELVMADELKLYPGNYRKHKAKQLDRMVTVIKGKKGKDGNGWRRCAVVSTLSGYVVKGNGMVQMAQRQGWQVPVEYQKYRTKAEEIRDLVADNRLAALAEDDDDALKKLLSELKPDELEFSAVTDEDLSALIKDAEIPEAEFPITAKLHEGYDYLVVFTRNETDFVYLQSLCGIEPERSYKKTGIGIGRVIPFDRFLSSINANLHSHNVPGRDHDNAHADPGGEAGCAGEPSQSVS